MKSRGARRHRGKPEGDSLQRLKRHSLELLYERLLDAGSDAQDLTLDAEAGQLLERHDGGTRVLFDQAEADLLIRRRFESYRSLLPEHYRIHKLPVQRVGALATHKIDAAAGHGDKESEDFIAFAIGIMKIPLWGIVLAELLSGDLGLPMDELYADIKKDPAYAWWRCPIVPIADALLGWSWGSPIVEKIAAWYRACVEYRSSEISFTCVMQGFLFYHEIGHYELQHGEYFRAYSQTGRLPREWNHFMEGEADQFALSALRELYNDDAYVCAALDLLFTLFALESDVRRQYPSCDDSDAYPHPLTRLIWLLREVFNLKLGEVSDHLCGVLKVVSSAATVQGMNVEDEMLESLFGCVMQKPSRPGRPI